MIWICGALDLADWDRCVVTSSLIPLVGVLWVWTVPAQAQQTAATPQPIPASGTLQLGLGESTDEPIPEGVVLPPAERYRVQPTRVENGPTLDGVPRRRVLADGGHPRTLRSTGNRRRASPPPNEPSSG